MRAGKGTAVFALLLALAGGLAGCQTGYDEEPGMRDSGTQTGQRSGGASGSASGSAGGTGGSSY